MKRWMSGIGVLGGAAVVMLTVAAWTKPDKAKQDKAAQSSSTTIFMKTPSFRTLLESS